MLRISLFRRAIYAFGLALPARTLSAEIHIIANETPLCDCRCDTLHVTACMGLPQAEYRRQAQASIDAGRICPDMTIHAGIWKLFPPYGLPVRVRFVSDDAIPGIFCI
jgi:hypothetical protein